MGACERPNGGDPQTYACCFIHRYERLNIRAATFPRDIRYRESVRTRTIDTSLTDILPNVPPKRFRRERSRPRVVPITNYNRCAIFGDQIIKSERLVSARLRAHS